MHSMFSSTFSVQSLNYWDVRIVPHVSQLRECNISFIEINTTVNIVILITHSRYSIK